MILSGKCKEEFEGWLFEKTFHNEDYDNAFGVLSDIPFEDYPASMQYGVLIDFFEQEGNIFIGRENMVDYFVLALFEDGSYKEYSIPDRTEAIKKADELFNEKFKR